MYKIIKTIKRTFERGIENKEITLEELEDLIKKGVTVIDVRSPQEYKEGHIDSAISIPEYDINRKILERFDINEELIVYCTTGYRSRRAKKKLEKMGYSTVYNLKDGIF